ncbi:MAG: tetratricopeptide repeat protein, partial [Planctomycetota bacterium]|nr:tetratricopeptide repeat protein [Planctomycetota bacterium]
IARAPVPPERISFKLSPDDKVSLGLFWEENCDLEKAAEFYLQAYNEFSDRRKRAVALTNAGNARFRQGDEKTALILFETAVKEDPTYAPALNNFAYTLLKTEGDLNRALELVQKALALDPRNERIYLKTLNQIKENMEKRTDETPYK